MGLLVFLYCFIRHIRSDGKDGEKKYVHMNGKLFTEE